MVAERGNHFETYAVGLLRSGGDWSSSSAIQLSPSQIRTCGFVRGAVSNGRPYRECAEHVRQLEGESPFHNLMDEIAKRKGVVARRGLKEAWSKRRG